MNENLKSFISDIGILCETWTVIYKSFLAQGMAPNEAMKHTQGFLTALMDSTLGKQKGEN